MSGVPIGAQQIMQRWDAAGGEVSLGAFHSSARRSRGGGSASGSRQRGNRPATAPKPKTQTSGEASSPTVLRHRAAMSAAAQQQEEVSPTPSGGVRTPSSTPPAGVASNNVVDGAGGSIEFVRHRGTITAYHRREKAAAAAAAAAASQQRGNSDGAEFPIGRNKLPSPRPTGQPLGRGAHACGSNKKAGSSNYSTTYTKSYSPANPLAAREYHHRNHRAVVDKHESEDHALLAAAAAFGGASCDIEAAYSARRRSPTFESLMDPRPDCIASVFNRPPSRTVVDASKDVSPQTARPTTQQSQTTGQQWSASQRSRHDSNTRAHSARAGTTRQQQIYQQQKNRNLLALGQPAGPVASMNGFMTTQQESYGRFRSKNTSPAEELHPVGFTNPSIVAEKARWRKRHYLQ